MHCNSMPTVHRSVHLAVDKILHLAVDKIFQIEAFMTNKEVLACADSVLKALNALDEQARTAFALEPDLLVAHGMIAGSMKRISGEPPAHCPYARESCLPDNTRGDL